MANKLISLSNLETYHSYIKGQISAVETLAKDGIKFVEINATTGNLDFYRVRPKEGDAAYSLPLPPDLTTRMGQAETDIDALQDILDGYTTKGSVAAAVKAVNDVIGVASKAETSEGAGDGVEATGLQARIETLESAVGEGGSVASQIATEIGKLDATVTNVSTEEGATQPDVAVSITETDGKLTEVTATVKANTFDAYGAATAVQGSTTETVKSVNDKVIKLNGTVGTNGSVLNLIKNNAKDGIYSSTTETKYQLSLVYDTPTQVINIETEITKEQKEAIDNATSSSPYAVTGIYNEYDSNTNITIRTYDGTYNVYSTGSGTYASTNTAPTESGIYRVYINENTTTTTTTIAEAIAAAQSSAVSGSVVTVEKQASADTGYAATYVVKQNGSAVGDKINIPKDWLLTDVSLETADTADSPEAGYAVGDKYFDFSFNTKDASETITHVYLKANELVDVYTSGSAATDAIVVAIDNSTNKITASLTDGTVSRAKIDSAFESDISTLEGLHSKTGDVYKTVSAQIADEAKSAIYSTETTGYSNGETTITVAEYEALEADAKAGYTAVTQETTIAQAIKANADAITNIDVSGDIEAKINALDVTVSNEATGEGATQPDVVISVTETDGKLTAVTATVTAERFDAYGAAAQVKTDLDYAVATDAEIETIWTPAEEES